MSGLKWFVWLFPLLFIVHDMEEIIMAKNWCEKGLKQHIKLFITPFGGTKSTVGFAIGVYEELLLFMFFTMIGNVTGFYGIWFGLMVANIIHLLLFHIILLPLSYRSYVPGEVTAWLTIVPCFYILKLAQNTLMYSFSELVIWIIVGFIVTFVNVKILHKNINRLLNLIN